MTYREMYDNVVMSGKYPSGMAKVKQLAQLIYANDRTADKEDCVVAALEHYENMTGRYLDPTHEEWESIRDSII